MKRIPLWNFKEKAMPSLNVICRRKLKRLQRKRAFVKIPFEIWYFAHWDELTICEDNIKFSDHIKKYPNNKMYIINSCVRNINIKKMFKSEYRIKCGILYDGWTIREMMVDDMWDFVSPIYVEFNTKSEVVKYKLEN